MSDTVAMKSQWENYPVQDFFDELMTDKGHARQMARPLVRHFKKFNPNEIDYRQNAAELAIKEMGISFTVYSQKGNIDRAWPFDIIPRVIREQDWRLVSQGLIQRLKALNHFINDVYNEQKIFKQGVIPSEIVLDSPNFRPECVGIKPVYGVWAHICGTDLVRDRDGQFYVLEDNLRVPSGVSYMIENREITKRILPEIFKDYSILPVDDYPSRLYQMLASISPRKIKRPNIVVLTPGIYNSAYFEHAYLAQGMGVELVEGSDLFVSDDDVLYMHTVDGPEQVDVVYRRIDDAFIDPEVFREDSILGVPGLMRAWKKQKIALANAPGAGVADDKVVYAYVGKMIEFYLGEQPILNSVKTYLCSDENDQTYVLDHLNELVIKPANESGGYGILIGPQATAAKLKKFAKLIKQNPRNYIAQPTLTLSTAPTVCEGNLIEPRHLDLRPFILQGKDAWVTAGGLTRVALKKGSLVVNSSQGGGSKDTWIIEERAK